MFMAPCLTAAVLTMAELAVERLYVVLLDQGPLRFACLSETGSKLKKDREIFSIPSLTKVQIVKDMSGDNSDFRVN